MPKTNETERLAKLLETLPLLKGSCISHEEIAERVGCTADEARRMVTQLSDVDSDSAPLGIAVVTAEEVRAALARFGDQAPEDLAKLSVHGGIILTGERGMLTEPLRLDSHESRALLLALDYAGISDDAPLREKLVSRTMPADADGSERLRIRLDQTGSYGVLRTLSLLCRQGRTAELAYRSSTASENARSSGNDASYRKIAPLELYTAENGSLYLDAFAYDREDLRTFRVDRIVDVHPLAEHASPRIRALRGRRELIDPSGPHAVLKARSDVRLDGRRWLMAESEELPDGTQRVTLPMRESTAWLSRAIVARLGGVEVESPRSLADDVLECARQTLADIRALESEYAQAKDA